MLSAPSRPAKASRKAAASRPARRKGRETDNPTRRHAASDGTHRLIWGPWGNQARLFDVGADPGESTDLRQRSPQRARALHELRNAFIEDARTISGSASEFSREDLEAMGYAGRDGSGSAGGTTSEPLDLPPAPEEGEVRLQLEDLAEPDAGVPPS